jgi:transcriptional regulator with XRE-family HTH domain
MFGYQLLCWRRHRGFTQLDLAQKTNVPRPYLSRLELDKVDPSLSLIRRLAAALDLRIGELIEELPVFKLLTNEELDSVARAALRPSSPQIGKAVHYVRALSRALKERRAAVGLYKPRGKKKRLVKSSGIQSIRRLRADLGDTQWRALLKRVDKHAVYLAPKDKK